MSKKSYKEIIAELEKQNYNFNYFESETIGNYLPEDADWNYKDIEHPKLVHSDFSAIPTYVSEDMACSINIQKIPFIGISLPLLIINYEYSKFNQTYYTSFGPFIIFIDTNIKKIEANKTSVKTKYAVGSKKIFKFLHGMIGKILLKNYRKLMSEDTPMRDRKGKLRKIGHHFFSPNATYPFNYSEQISKSNVYLKVAEKNTVQINKSDILKSQNGNTVGEKIGVLSFFISEDENKIKLWPSTCSHEGAELSSKCIKGERIFCPWHNRISMPIAIMDKINKNLKINNSKDYEVIDEEDRLKIVYKNIK